MIDMDGISQILCDEDAPESDLRECIKDLIRENDRIRRMYDTQASAYNLLYKMVKYGKDMPCTMDTKQRIVELLDEKVGMLKEIDRLRKIEAAAVEVCGLPNWNNDTWINKMYELDAALKEASDGYCLRQAEETLVAFDELNQGETK